MINTLTIKELSNRLTEQIDRLVRDNSVKRLYADWFILNYGHPSLFMAMSLDYPWTVSGSDAGMIYTYTTVPNDAICGCPTQIAFNNYTVDARLDDLIDDLIRADPKPFNVNMNLLYEVASSLEEWVEENFQTTTSDWLMKFHDLQVEVHKIRLEAYND